MSPPARPYFELDSSAAIKQTLIWQVFGLFLLVSHLLLVRENALLFPIAIVALIYLYAKAPLAGICVYFQILLYQNLVLAWFSSDIDLNTFSLVQGTNFVAISGMALVAFNRLLARSWRRNFKTTLITLLVALSLAFIYTVIGMVRSTPQSAMVYFREFTSPLLAVFVGLDVGRTWGYKTVATCFVTSAVFAVILGIVEYCIPAEYYELINAVAFYQWKFYSPSGGNAFYTPADIIDHLTSPFFNVTGATIGRYDSFRFGGTILNPISFAYILSILALISITMRKGIWLFVLLPMLFLIGSKGAALLFITSLIMLAIWYTTVSKKILVFCGICLMIGYIGSGLATGMSNGDFHVIGFLGGVNSLLHNPFGHGIGVGGNLSAKVDAGFKWTGEGSFSSLGADFALESAIGVLFYQMGLACIAILMVFIILLRNLPLGKRVYVGMRSMDVPRREDLILFALAMIPVNGVFQEEAFAPYAAGLVMLLCGLILSNARRPKSIYRPRVDML